MCSLKLSASHSVHQHNISLCANTVKSNCNTHSCNSLYVNINIRYIIIYSSAYNIYQLPFGICIYHTVSYCSNLWARDERRSLPCQCVWTVRVECVLRARPCWVYPSLLYSVNAYCMRPCMALRVYCHFNYIGVRPAMSTRCHINQIQQQLHKQIYTII